MKRALVIRANGEIRTRGDTELAVMMVDGVSRPVEPTEMEAARAEIKSLNAEVKSLKMEVAGLRREVARLGVREVRDKAYFANQMLTLDEHCPPVRESGKIAQALLIGWAVLTLTIREFYR